MFFGRGEANHCQAAAGWSNPFVGKHCCSRNVGFGWRWLAPCGYEAAHIQAEWKGTDIVFEITRQGDKTELRFTHVGLVPAFECYGDCSGAWGYYINDSLHSLITTGKEQPNQKE